jgi:hypothetical protein
MLNGRPPFVDLRGEPRRVSEAPKALQLDAIDPYAGALHACQHVSGSSISS